MMRMLRLSRVGLGCFMAIALASADAMAAGSVFTLERWPVDATGESTTAARDIALARGRSAALQQVFRRLTPQEYWGSLPSVDSAELELMVDGIQIANEKTSRTRYLAEVSYEFDPDQVRDILVQSGIPFSESQARDLVVVPVLENQGQFLLWEEENPWLAAWQNKPLANELVPIIAPLGELDDIVAMPSADAVAENANVLRDFARRYGVGGALLAKASLTGEGATQSLNVRLVQVTVTGGATVGSGVNQFIVRNTEAWELGRFLDFAMEQGVPRLRNAWKEQTIVFSNAPTTPVTAVIQFETHQAWIAVRDRLKATPTIRNFNILGVSPSGADVDFDYVGTIEQLRLNLAQRDLNLLDGGSFVMIALRAPLDELGGETPVNDGMSPIPGNAAAGDESTPDAMPAGDTFLQP